VVRFNVPKVNSIHNSRRRPVAKLAYPYLALHGHAALTNATISVLNAEAQPRAVPIGVNEKQDWADDFQNWKRREMPQLSLQISQRIV
jgi:hypothetical protein